MQTEEINRLSERLDGLERQNRRLKRLLLLMPLLFLSMGAATRLAYEETVTAKTVIITDGNRNRIALGVTDAGRTYINVWDKGGKWVKALGEEQP